MLNKLFLLISIFWISINSIAQNTIKGTVFNEENEPLANATAVLLNPADSIMKYFGITNKEGYYEIKNIKNGNYLMQVSFVGTQMITGIIIIPSKQGEDLGKKVLKWNASLGNINIVADYVPLRFRNDTVEFNAKAFITKPDAVVEDLLKKIPGIEVDLAGNIKALGEDVKKVLVDGKEFFGRDTKVATKNLPANAIDKVEVFDKKSYEAEFTGINDGIHERTINLKLTEDAKVGYFGDAEAGAGTRDHYKVTGKIYRFTDVKQMAALGMYNNINEFGFAAPDLGKFGSQVNGINSTGAGGLNYSYNPTTFDKYYVSYLGSISRKQVNKIIEARYFSEQGTYDQFTGLIEDARNTPHSFDFGIHRRFNTKHNLIFTGNVDLINSDLDQLTNVTTFNDIAKINILNSNNKQLSDMLQGSANGSYMVKLKEGRTQFKTEFNVSILNSFSGSELNNSKHIFNPDSTVNTNQFLDKHNGLFNASFNPSFVQKIGNLWHISPELNIGINNEMIDQKQGDLQTNKLPIDTLSPDFIRKNSFVKTGLAFQRIGVTNQFDLSISTEWDHFGGILNDETNSNSTYFNLLPSVSYEIRPRTGRRFSARYSTAIGIPSAIELMPVINNKNPIALYIGNPDLKPEYTHTIFSDMSVFDQFSYTTIFLRAGGTYTKDKISLSQTIDKNLLQTTSPVNVPKDFTLNGYISFSTPLNKFGMKASLTLNENWHRGINIVNSEDNILKTNSHSVSFTIESYMKEKLNYKIGSSVALTDTKYTIHKALNNLYFNNAYFCDILYNPNDRWNFQLTSRLTNYKSKTLKETFSVPLIDASISYYFMKGERGVFNLKGIDLLNRNTGFQQTSDINYLMQVNNNTLGRYVMLSFKYRLNKMGRNK